MTIDEISQWYFTEAELACTPSVEHGLPIAEERCRRAKAVNFIIQAGILLKLPQLTLATASVFLHRFYMRYSMVSERGGLHHYNIAATALFLATKTEENGRKTKEIVIAVAKVAQKNASLIIDEQSKEYWRWRDNILLYEELMLEYLTFDVVLQSPYSSLYNFLQQLQVEDNKQLRNVAWAFLNDSCLTIMCLLMHAKDIAVAAVYFAAKFTGEKITDDEKGRPWWEQLGGKPDLIVKAVGVMNEFYTENPLRRNDNPYEQSPGSFGNEEDLERTRGRGEADSNRETPSPEERARSQRSQNGHSDQDGDVENGSPLLNGKRSAGHHSNRTNVNENHISAQPREAVTIITSLHTLDGSGSSDTPLKEAANDPATHQNGDTNGMEHLFPAASNRSNARNTSPKRKVNDAVESVAKRKRSNSGESVPAVMSEASEEGELDE